MPVNSPAFLFFRVMKSLLVWMLVLVVLASCHTAKPFYGEKGYVLPELPTEVPLAQVVLVGDAGDMQIGEPIRDHVPKYLTNDLPNALLFLGDNIYTYGLPEEGAEDYNEKKEILLNQMSLADNFDGRVIFIPGNHDWKKSKEGGWATVLRQEAAVNQYYDRSDAFLPSGGCPGPVLVPFTNEISMIVLNSEWWLYGYTKPGTDECETGSRELFYSELKQLVRNNSDKQLLVMGHHPIVSNGEHGGYFSAMDHLFPLRNVKDWLYFPLPVIGSIYPISRKLGVSSQDIPNKEFQTYADTLRQALAGHKSLIYASGHEHNLQLHATDEFYQVISGSGSKTNFARKGLGADYVQTQEGFARLIYYSNETWIEYFVIERKTGDLSSVFRKMLYRTNP